MTYAKAFRAARHASSQALCGTRGQSLSRARRHVTRQKAGRVCGFLFVGPAALENPDILTILRSLSPEIGLVVRDYEGAKSLQSVLQQAKCQRRLCLVAPRRKTGFGQHIPRWQRPPKGLGNIQSMSVHTAGEAIRARRSKADIVFISPVFPTRSHPSARVLGVFQARRLARLYGGPAYGLGGINHQNIKALGKGFDGFAAISGFAAP